MDAKKVALKLIDEEGLKAFLLDDVLDGIVKAKLDELTQSTEITLDDAVVAMVYPIVRDAVSKYIDEQIAKLSK